MASPAPRVEPEAPVSVIVRDVEMSFGSMVVFMIKWTLAAIPAMIILLVVGFFVVALLGGMAGAFRP